MSALNLPDPIAAYFAAEHDPEALGRCFTERAVLKDEGHTHAGVDAIKEFMAKALAQYSATSSPLSLTAENGAQVVRAQVAGNFPGSPIELRFRFRLEGGLIASLEIAA